MTDRKRSHWESKLQVEQVSLWLLGSLTLSRNSSRESREALLKRIQTEFKISQAASVKVFEEAWRVLKTDFDDERMVLLRTMIKELSDIYYRCKEEEKYSYALKALSQMAQIIGLESRNIVKVETTTRELESVESKVLLEAVGSGENARKG